MSNVVLPELAKDVNKATVSFWLVDIGEDIAEGQDLVEMLTDKATFNVPAPFAGKLTSTAVTEGQEVNVGDVIATIEEA